MIGTHAVAFVKSQAIDGRGGVGHARKLNLAHLLIETAIRDGRTNKS
jgi:hypothetical protein